MSVTLPESNTFHPSRIAKAVTAFGTLVATLAVGVAVGPLGILMAVGVASAYYVVSATAAFALGQVILVALVPSGGIFVILVLAEIGLLGVLCSTIVDHGDSARLLVASVLAGLAIGAIGWLSFQTSQAVWIAASALALATAFSAYGIHRYERVTLGLVETSATTP